MEEGCGFWCGVEKKETRSRCGGACSMEGRKERAVGCGEMKSWEKGGG